MRDPRNIIVRPVVTERSSELVDERGTYTFIVNKDSNKIEIKHAVETLFGVKVKNVRTANYQGKWRRVGTALGRKAAYKKAVVTLVAGETIDVYEGA